MMDVDEMVRLHTLLHSEADPIEYPKDSKRWWRAHHYDEAGRKFSRVILPEDAALTQNLMKASVNTDWVLATPGAKLTWFTHGPPLVPGGLPPMVAQVREWDEDTRHILEVHDLGNKRILARMVTSPSENRGQSVDATGEDSSRADP